MKLYPNARILMLLENCSYPRDDRVRREAKSLISAGYRVSVISPAGHGQPWHETIDRVVVYRYPASLNAGGFWGYLWEYGYAMTVTFILAMFILVRDGFDVIHAHQPPDTFGLLAAFFKFLGKRYVLDHHDLAPELYYARFRGNGNRSVYHVLVTLEKIACKLADHVIATNQSYMAVEMKRGHVPSRRISIVRNGPDLTELCCPNHDSHVHEDGKTILMYVGVMGTQDGVDYLLRALYRLRTDLSRKDFKCILVGSGDALPGLKSMSQELDLVDFVHFTGWVDSQQEVARYLYASDICIAPEPSDPYNDRSTAAKVLEYMAMGKPIVCFDLPEHRISAQEAAVYAQPNDELALAKLIVLLMDNPIRRRQMGLIGRERIERKLAWQCQSKELLKAYQSLIQ